MLDKVRPVYTIGTAAELLHVHPRTLRLYEDGGLIRPFRKNNRRFYSSHDLQWISCVRYLLHETGLNQEGVRRLLALIPCWEVKGCAPEVRANCPAWQDRSTPCWDLARQGQIAASRCYECEAYVSAMDHLLDPREREAAVNYIMADQRKRSA